MECVELCLGMQEEPTETFWIAERGQTKVTLQWVFAIGHPSRKTKCMRPSTES